MLKPVRRHPPGGVLLAAALAVASLLPACRQPDSVPLEPAEAAPSGSRVPSAVHVADADATDQLKYGFHGLEQGSWRWTERRFGVAVGPPAGAAARGGTLTLRFSIPAAIIDRFHQLTLTASVGGVVLNPATYNKPGEYVYAADVPASVLGGDLVNLEFTLDHALPPTDTDRRELGVIASSVSLDAK